MQIILGQSVAGRDIVAHANVNFTADRINNPNAHRLQSTLIIGGTHGDERATVPLAERFLNRFRDTDAMPAHVAMIPILNPDGVAADTRYNGRGVDLNRNFPHQWSAQSVEPPGSKPLSEPESQSLHDFILEWMPAKIISLHWALAEIDADGPQSASLGRHIWSVLPAHRENPYRLRLQENAVPFSDPCPGSLGLWAGHGLVYRDGRRPAMITLELPFHPQATPRPETLPENHWDMVRSMWAENPDQYLAGVEKHVYRILDATCGFSMNFENADHSPR